MLIRRLCCRCLDGLLAPYKVITDTATWYPPALRKVLANVEHRTSTQLTNAIERDHSHLKQRRYLMHEFKQAAAADILAHGYACIHNLCNGCSTLTAAVSRPLRLMRAWSQLMEAI